jgi:lipid-A-disaccharide synthase-like uncharacterized protein
MMAESQIVEGIKEAAARQQHGKHVSVEMSKHATVEELSEMMFSMRFMLRLYSKDCHESSQLSVRGWSQWLAVLSCIVSSRYLAVTNEDIVFAGEICSL